MRWVEFSVSAGNEKSQEIADILADYGQGGAIIEKPELEQESGFCKVMAYIPYKRGYNYIRAKIETELCNYNVSVSEKMIKSQDWIDAQRKHFKVQEIGRNFIVKPSWIDQKTLPSEKIVLELDPGAAFGTGLHATTRLCLCRLEQHLLPGMSVFDLGTGTGILAIAAAKLRAGRILAVDIDPVAVKTARLNADINHVLRDVDIRRSSLSESSARKYKNQFDIALANITSRAICCLSKQLYKVVKPGGILITSGIHPQGVDEVLISLALANFKISDMDRQGDWYSVIGIKP